MDERERNRAIQIYRIRQAIDALQNALDCLIIANVPRTTTKAIEILEGRDRLTEIDADRLVRDQAEKVVEEQREQAKRVTRYKLALVKG